MKFDFVIGNPPYQDNTLGKNETFAPQIYNKFLDAAAEVADKVELIHPARFLFNAGSTPKEWNKKMLNNPHFKVLEYFERSETIFQNTEIKGGLAISYSDKKKDFGPIEVFLPWKEATTILKKVKTHNSFNPLSKIMVSSYAYHFTEELYKDYPQTKGKQSQGHEYDLKSNVFTQLPEPFFDEKPKDDQQYAKILGRENNERVYKYINKRYLRNDVRNFSKYKVFMPKATGTGKYGEKLNLPIVGFPDEGATETFMSIGAFGTKTEAQNTIKYICTKFARAMYGFCKKTQDNTPDKWKYVPCQDFTSKSDLDWTKSTHSLDMALYKKYKLAKKKWTSLKTE